MNYTTITWTMARIKLFIITIFLSSGALAQLAPGKYWVEFSDKNNSPFSIDEPAEFLSERAIARRENQGIAIDVTDLPVNQDYINQVLALGDMDFLYASKWFNAIVVAPEDSTVLEEVLQLPFVIEVRSVKKFGHNPVDQRPEESFTSREMEEYGEALHQIAMLNGHLLHETGFTGEGMRIGVMDGGFSGANAMDAFAPLIADGRLIGTHDFVDGDNDVFHSSSHGTLAWSAMAAMWPDSIIGSAPAAEYMLFRTENVASEFQLEEVNWIAAAEMADSAGVDVLNTSLGYTTFDDSLQNYDYEDMDGQTTWISRAGNMAARKGMLVVNSAGNSGNNPWHYIGAPADADSVLAVGAVTADSVVTTFSSRGPSFDGRVKPNVCAQGFQTVMANSDNTIIKGNGTSFSSPVMAGLAACLWQSNPTATNMQVFASIEQSAHLYTSPNDSIGYGLPDFLEAVSILEEMVVNVDEAIFEDPVFTVFPNPFSEMVFLRLNSSHEGSAAVAVFDINGRLIQRQSFPLQAGPQIINLREIIADLPGGSYLLRLNHHGVEAVQVIQKVD